MRMNDLDPSEQLLGGKRARPLMESLAGRRLDGSGMRESVARQVEENEKQREGKVDSRMQDLMKDGVPVKQWLLLLVLMGAGVWQLRKTITPAKPGNQTKSRTPSKQNNRKKKTKRSNKNQHKNRSFIPNSDKGDKRDKQQHQEQPLINANNTGKKKKTKTKKSTKLAPSNPIKKETPESPADYISTDGSDSTSRPDPDALLSVPENGHQGVHFETDDAGWNTITKKNKVVPNARPDPLPVQMTLADGAPAQNGKHHQPKLDTPQHEETDLSVHHAQDQTEQEPEQEQEPQLQEYHEPAEQVETSDQDEYQPVKKTKKKKKKKQQSSPISNGTHQPSESSPEVPPPMDTTEDEALAMHLQREEERLARVQEPLEEVWEEVSFKKKKNQAVAADSETQ